MTVEKIFIDTNILVYAYDNSAGKKHLKAKEIVASCFSGKKEFFISNQVLAEFCRVVLWKIGNPISEDEVQSIIFKINNFDWWKKINYSNKTIENVFFEKGIDFWDKLIVSTMKENGVFKIYTENVSDFKEMIGIQAVNPL